MPSVKLLTSSGILEFAESDWSETFPNIEVFDSTFVSDNIFAGDLVDIVHRRNLYRIVIGDQGVQLAEGESALDRRSRELALAIRQLETDLESRLPQEINLDLFISLPDDPQVADKIEKQQRRLDAARKAHELNTRDELHEVTLPVLPSEFPSLLLKTIDDIADDAERHILNHLKAHSMSTDDYSWLAQGMRHVDQNTCPFCGQDISPVALISHYRSVFSERYEALRSRVTSMRESINAHFGDKALADLQLLDERNKNSFDFWSDYCPIGDAPPAIPSDLISTLRTLRNSALDMLTRKEHAPTEQIVPPPDYKELVTRYNQINEAVRLLATRICSINELIQRTKNDNSNTDIATEQRRLEALHAQQLRHSEPISRHCTELSLHQAEKDDIETKKQNVRSKLEQHTEIMMPKYQDDINRFLDYFNADFTLTNFDSSYAGGRASSQYQILINNIPVNVGTVRTPDTQQSFKNTLSAGDRTNPCPVLLSQPARTRFGFSKQSSGFR